MFFLQKQSWTLQIFQCNFGKIGRCASEEVVFALIKTKCLPVLLYRTEVCPTNAADLQSMQFAINTVIIKLFGTMSQNYYQEVSNYFGINTVKVLIHNRFQKFRISYGAADNYLCRLIFAKCWTYFDCTVYIFFLATVFWRWNEVIYIRQPTHQLANFQLYVDTIVR